MTAWLCDNLITNVRSKAWLSENNTNFTNTQILDVAYEQASKILLPLVRAVDHSYYLSKLEVALTTSTVRYRIPPRATTRGIVSATLFDSDGRVCPIKRIESHLFDQLKPTETSKTPIYYCIYGSYIQIWPQVNEDGAVLKISYQRRIPQFIESSSASVIDTIDAGGASLDTTASISWITADPFKVDIMYQAPEADLIVTSAPATQASATQIDFSPALDTTIVDEIETEKAYNSVYVCLEDTTPIVPFVDTLCFALEDFTAGAILRRQNKEAQAVQILQDARDYLDKMLSPLASRVNKEPIKITNINSNLLGYRW